MKHLFSGLMGGFVLFLLLTSCTKESKEIPIGGSYNRSASEVSFLATHWEKDSDGNFVCLLNEVTSSAPDATTMKVYVVTDTAEMLVSNGPIDFMDGQLWAKASVADLEVIYRPHDSNSDKPFYKLNIKIVFTN